MDDDLHRGTYKYPVVFRDLRIEEGPTTNNFNPGDPDKRRNRTRDVDIHIININDKNDDGLF